VIGAARAETTVIGVADQSSTQGSTMSQLGNNIVQPLPVVGTNHSVGTQTGVSDLSDGEAIAPTGGAVIGSTNQDSSQGSAGIQVNVGSKTMTNVAVGLLGNDQLVGADVIIGDSRQANRQGNDLSQSLTGSKVAMDTILSDLGNRQIIGSGAGAVIIGTTGQTSLQGDNTAQSVTQKASNPTIGNSTLTVISTTIALQDNRQGVAAGTIIGTTNQQSDQGHNGSQAYKQTSAPVTTGNYAPIASELNVVITTDCQTVTDNSGPCLLF
jgi:hypothetical protein